MPGKDAEQRELVAGGKANGTATSGGAGSFLHSHMMLPYDSARYLQVS